MEYEKLLVEDNFVVEPAGFYSRTLWFLDCKAYPGIFEILRTFALRHLHKSDEEMIDYDVYIVIDPSEGDYQMDLLFEDKLVETFYPDENQRGKCFADLMRDVEHSCQLHVPPF